LSVYNRVRACIYSYTQLIHATCNVTKKEVEETLGLCLSQSIAMVSHPNFHTSTHTPPFAPKQSPEPTLQHTWPEYPSIASTPPNPPLAPIHPPHLLPTPGTSTHPTIDIIPNPISRLIEQSANQKRSHQLSTTTTTLPPLAQERGGGRANISKAKAPAKTLPTKT